MQLTEKLNHRQANVGIIGLGYVGLPLAVEFARAGFTVTGFDVDEAKVADINSGRSYILDVKTEDVAACVSAGRLRATTDMSKLGEMDAVDICVPTPLRKTKDPDMSYVVSAAEQIAKYIRPGMQRRHVRIGVAQFCASAVQQLQDVERRRLAHVAHVFLVRDPKEVYACAVDCLLP